MSSTPGIAKEMSGTFYSIYGAFFRNFPDPPVHRELMVVVIMILMITLMMISMIQSDDSDDFQEFSSSYRA